MFENWAEEYEFRKAWSGWIQWERDDDGYDDEEKLKEKDGLYSTTIVDIGHREISRLQAVSVRK